MRGFKADSSRTYYEIEREAHVARRALGLSPTQRVVAIDLMDRLGDFQIPLSQRTIQISAGVADLAPGVMAQTSFTGGAMLIEVSTGTYERMERREPRATFTFGHEVGHLLQHTHELMRLSSMHHSQAGFLRGQAQHQVYQDTEWQADAFSAALLAPAAALLELESQNGGTLSPADIEEMLGLSGEAARIRCSNWIKRRSDLVRAIEKL